MEDVPVQLLTERQFHALSNAHNQQLLRIARWAAEAHAWMQRAEIDQHHFGCGVYPLVDHKPPSACDCGLRTLLAKIAPPEVDHPTNKSTTGGYVIAQARPRRG